jgi:chorismate mutase
MTFPRRNIYSLSAILCILVSTAAGCAPSTIAAANPGSLSDLISKRLDLGKDVAWTKFNSNAPVFDPKREAAVLEQVLTRADRLGLDHQKAKRFFAAQISASREVQIEAIDSWKHGAGMPVSKPMSLTNDIRPEIDSLDNQLLTVLAKGGFDGAHVGEIQAQLISKGFSEIAAHLAAEGVAQ